MIRRPPPRLSLALLGFALGLVFATTAVAQKKEESTKDDPFLKTRITFSFGDDNVLVGAGETKKSSPSAYFGNCDAANTIGDASDCGKSQTDLILYKRLQLSPFFQPEAALAIGLNVVSGDIQDAGSYIRANYFMDERHETYWAVTLFPVDADRLRLGYYWDVSWGGTDSFPKNFRRGYAPGLKFDLDYRYWHLFVGVKAAKVRSPAEDILDNPGGNTLKNVERTFYGALGGAGFEFLNSGVRLELNGGFFNKGTNTRQNALGKPIYAGGVSTRLSYRHGMEIGRQIDVRIHQQDPVRDQLFKKETYRAGQVSVRAEVEATWLIQNLEDPDTVSSTVNEQSWMGHAGFALKVGYFRLHIDAIFRDLTAITFDVPGFIPYQALSKDAAVTPELSGTISADYNIQPVDLTIGLTFGILKPATYEGVAPLGMNVSSVNQGNRKVVVRGSKSGDWDILPPGEDELPVMVVRLDLKWNYYDAFAIVGTMYYGRDDNTAQVVQDAQGHNIRQFDEPNALGFTLLTRVKF